MDFRTASIGTLASEVQSGQRTAVSLTEAALARIDAVNDQVNAFVAVDRDAALAQAAAIDERVARGTSVGPLAGIPLGVKDLEDAAGFVTTHGSPAHADDPPASADSILVQRLRVAGCVVIGKTNTPEFGWKADTENPVFGATANPWSLGRSAGGSSGGSGAAIASGMVPLATGSDGGGSIRIPSAINGLSGMKTSLGRIPSGDPGWVNLSSKGPMARRISDVTHALDACIGPHPTDIRSLPMPRASWADSMADPEPPRRVAWSPTLGYAPVDREVRAACEEAVNKLAAAGTEVIEVDTVFDADPAGAWVSLAYTYNLRSLEAHRDTEVWNRLDPGLVSWMEWSARKLTALDLVKADDQCHALNQRLVEVFHDTSALLTPVLAGQTPFGRKDGTVDGEETASWVSMTYPFNMTRSPAGTVPVGLTADGMPIGLQIIGPQHADVAVLRLIAVMERLVGFDAVASGV